MIDLEISLLETAPPPSVGNKLQVENKWIDWSRSSEKNSPE
jgi:hypothetical protein